MKLTWRAAFLLVLLPLWIASAGASRDPLNPAEVDEIRELAQEPDKRLKAFVRFAEARMVAIEQMRGDERLARRRGEKIRELLQDFGKIVDEIDANLEMYAERDADLRKPLKEIIETASAWQLKLRALKETSGVGAKEPELPDYQFALEDAAESVDLVADSAREELDRQIEARKKKK